MALPGGDFPVDGVQDLVDGLLADYPFLTPIWARRLIRGYGTEARAILGDAKTVSELGQDFGGTLSEAEARWLVEHEFARTADDILWRRSKLGLHMDEQQRAAFHAWLDTVFSKEALA